MSFMDVEATLRVLRKLLVFYKVNSNHLAKIIIQLCSQSETLYIWFPQGDLNCPLIYKQKVGDNSLMSHRQCFCHSPLYD